MLDYLKIFSGFLLVVVLWNLIPSSAASEIFHSWFKERQQLEFWFNRQGCIWELRSSVIELILLTLSLLNPPSAIVVPFVDFEARRLKYVTQHCYLTVVPIGVHLKLGFEKGFLIRGKELTLFVFNALPPEVVLFTLGKHLCIVNSFLNSLTLQALANG